MMAKTIRCRTCKETLPATSFTPSAIAKYDYQCKPCRSTQRSAGYRDRKARAQDDAVEVQLRYMLDRLNRLETLLGARSTGTELA